jgi:tRNA G18 (ribose-2'-O)-methylase SpoU
VALLRIQPLREAAEADLAPYTSLRRRKDLERQARFVAEGGKIVERLLESPFPVESLLLTQDWLELLQGRLDARPDAIHVLLAASKAEIERATGFPDRQGLKAVGRLPRATTLEEVLREQPRPYLFAALDGITNAENVGVVVRNAAALGVAALIAGETTCSPFLTRAIGTSMGAVFRLPIVEHTPLVEALRRLRAAGVACVAAHPSAAQRTLPEANLRQDCCLVLGSEGEGISPAILALCDESVSIPMSRGVDSLNVGSAAGVLFYEAWRQRRGTGP